MRMKLGSELAPAVQKDALARYCNRYTRTHVPYWVSEGPANYYKLQFDSDADWLAHTIFPVKSDDTLATGPCTSSPTWPDNPKERI